MGIGTVMKMGYTVVAVSLLLMIWVSLSHGREVEEVQYPPCVFNPLCSCSKAVPDLGIVVCQDVPLTRIPPQLNSSKIFMLHLENNNLRSIEPYFLQATGLYRLEISHNPMPEIPNEAFIGLERSLWELELQYNQLNSVPSRALRHLQKLRRLDLTGNKISDVMAESWRGLENSLQTLILAHNTLSSLPAEAFSSLPLLDTLDLTGNDLTALDTSTFRTGPMRLSHLLLGDNQLSSIPYQQLSMLKMLKTLDLSYNMVTNLHSATSEPEVPGMQMSLDTFRLDYNQIQYLPPGAFQHFDLLNRTYLDGNPIFMIEADAFRDARIRELSIRDCGVTALSPGAFSGLEASLQQLDLYGNNLTVLPQTLFHEFDFLKTLVLGENHLPGVLPGDSLNGFQYSLYRLDVSGRQMGVTSLQDLRRIRNLRAVTLSRLPHTQLSPEDFADFGLDLEELKISQGNLNTIKNHAFKHVRGLKRLDLSESAISQIEPEAFAEVGHSLSFLRMAHGLSPAVTSIPSEALRPLGNLQHLDFSNNRLRSMPETSFHFLRRLKVLQLQDNQIENVFKGTFQGGIHSSLEKLYLSFNNLNSINTHTFVDLTSLEQLYLDDNMISRVERRAFMNMDRLKQLNLRGNKIRSISDEAFQNLPELQTLDLAYNELRGFDFATMDQVGVLASFKVNVSHNRIQKLEVNTSSLSGRDGSGFFHSNIKVLDLSYNNISWFGRGYLKPVELSITQLYLGHNYLQNVTRDVFGNMPHLQWLDMSYNHITEIDFDSFRNTRRLQVVRLDNNAMTDIPAELFRGLSNLRVVDLSNNKLRNIPDGLFVEEGMEYLDLSYNQLSRVPTSCLGMSPAATLVEMDLSHNLITTLQGAEVFGKFKSLSKLDLSGNRLVRVEDGTFSLMMRLSHLDLSHNQGMVFENRGRSFRGLEDSLLHLGISNCSLTAVPQLPLPSLWSLDLSWNELSETPLEMTVNMTSLRRLDLSYNELSTVPMVAQSLVQLRELSLASNPITSLTNTTMIGGAQRLRHFDIRQMPLNFFETGALSKMTSLRTMELSPFKGVRNFNIPQVLQSNTGLRNLHIESHEAPGLQDEMNGLLPFKLRNITFSGQELRNIPQDALRGVRSPRLELTVINSSVESLPRAVFQHTTWVRNLTVDVRNNRMRALGNPSTGNTPGLPRVAFLRQLNMAGNTWSCNCELGWVEMWQRKKRQYLCGELEHNGECQQVDDDLRLALCANKNNATLIEVLKSEVECGWSSGSTTTAPIVILTVVISSIAALF